LNFLYSILFFFRKGKIHKMVIVCLIDFFHVADCFTSRGVGLEGGQVRGLFSDGRLVDAHSELDHSVDARRKGSWVFEGETRSEEGGLKEEPNEVLDRLVTLVGVGLLAEFLDDGVVRVQFEGLLGGHVSGHGRVAEGLGLHDLLHVSRPTVFSRDEDAR